MRRRAGTEIDDEQFLGELPGDGDEPAVPVVDQALAVEGDDVLAVVGGADGVDVDQWRADLGDVPPDQGVALVALAGVEGRGVEVEQHRRTLRGELAQRLDLVEVVPHVFADRHADARRAAAAGQVDRLAHFAGGEEALVVEIAVVGQQRLAGALQDPAVADDRRGVVLANRAVVVALVQVEVDEPDHRGDALRRLRDARDRPLVGAEEVGVFDQVADAVAGQRHLRRDDQIRLLPPRLFDRRDDRSRVAVDVSAYGIELRQGDSHEIDAISYRRSANRRSVVGGQLSAVGDQL